jgi:hypothetical protein
MEVAAQLFAAALEAVVVILGGYTEPEQASVSESAWVG